MLGEEYRLHTLQVYRNCSPNASHEYRMGFFSKKKYDNVFKKRTLQFLSGQMTMTLSNFCW